jgi:hypothetical protein
MNNLSSQYGTSYIKQLKQNREKAKREREATPKLPSLHERIETWFNALSEENQHRPFTMREFRALFEDTPQRIGAALFDLGWTRKRMWRDDRPTARYWLKQKR